MHQGEHVRQVINESGMSITALCKKLKKSRRWIYDIMQQPQVSVDVLIQLGNALHYNFMADFPEYRKFQYAISAPPNQHLQDVDGNYWKEKYYGILEQYSNLLVEKLQEKQKKPTQKG